MPSRRPSPVSESTEEGRAFLQARVALFWKVMFFISLLSSGLGAFGAIVEPGVEFGGMLAQTAQTGALWWLCARGQRSARFSRIAEGAGLVVNLLASAWLGRLVVGAFAHEHALVTAEGMLMTDAYVTMLHVAGIGLLLGVRAALVPSRPAYTAWLTGFVGVPLVALTFFVADASGRLSFRGSPSPAYPWLPATAAMLWGYVIITCCVISSVTYGLRAEVREARRLGQYVLEEKIGEGGMGEVYRARHGMMRRPSALKLMRSDIASATSLARFEREVQATARLTHPNTITIFDYGRTYDGVFYYAMELLDGATLQHVVDLDGPQPAGRVVRILTMACGALSEAHATGLIHRDIKPANIMLCTQGGEHDVAKLLDFGLVKELEVQGGVDRTGANTLTGTPHYMAPESILEADSADARADIYALGAVAYYLLGGREVFPGSSVVEVCGKHVHEQPERISARVPTVPADLEAVVLACLEKSPARRPQSAAELRERLEACSVTPWTAADARAWWERNRAALERDARRTTAAPRTIAVDATRSPAAV